MSSSGMKMEYNLPYKIIRIASFPNPPYTLDCFDEYPKGCLDPGPGSDVEYIYTVIRHVFQVPVKWVRVNNYIEMRQMLLNGSADIGGTSWTLEPEALEDLWYTNVFLYDIVALLFRRELMDLSSHFHVTSLIPQNLWLLAFSSFLLVYIVSHASRFCYRYFSFFKNSWFPTNVIRPLRERFIYSLFFLLLCVFFNLYSNIISVALVAKQTKFVANFETLDDVGKRILEKRCRLVLLNRYNQYSFFYRSLIRPTIVPELPWTKTFQEAYEVNPPLLVNTPEQLGKLVEDPTGCFIGVEFAKSELYYESHFCKIDVVPLQSFLQEERFIFLCASRILAENLNLVILSTQFQEYSNHILKRYIVGNVSHTCDEDYLAEEIGLNVGKAQDSFFAMLAGWIFGAICLFVEKKMPINYYFAESVKKKETVQVVSARTADSTSKHSARHHSHTSNAITPVG